MALLAVRNLKTHFRAPPGGSRPVAGVSGNASGKDRGAADRNVIRAVDGIDFTVEAGEVLALVGPNGATLDALQELTRLAVQQQTGLRSRLRRRGSAARERRSAAAAPRCPSDALRIRLHTARVDAHGVLSGRTSEFVAPDRDA